ncbi:MAG: hypothetical protein C4293_01585 [Nitrospiraceae bacterium]
MGLWKRIYVSNLRYLTAMDSVRKTAIAREWMIFALSIGLGGHIVLGLTLHTPELWPWNKAGVYGLLVGLSVYVSVQLVRSMWWVIRGSNKSTKS